MKVQIKYRDGRLDVFDTDSYTPSQPFGDGCMLANYEVRFDQLEKGCGCKRISTRRNRASRSQLEDDVVPVGRRAMGWRFLLAEEGELRDVEQVLVDGDRMLVRMGDGLVDVMRLDCASALLLSDGGGPSLASQLQGVVDALRASNDAMDDEAVANLAGASWEALVWARELQPLQQIEVESEEEGWMDYEGD